MLKTFMTMEDWNTLKTNILNLMVAGEEAAIESTAEKVEQPTSVIVPATPVVVSRMSAKAAKNVSQMFGVHAVQRQSLLQIIRQQTPKVYKTDVLKNLMLLLMMEYGSHWMTMMVPSWIR